MSRGFFVDSEDYNKMIDLNNNAYTYIYKEKSNA